MSRNKTAFQLTVLASCLALSRLDAWFELVRYILSNFFLYLFCCPPAIVSAVDSLMHGCLNLGMPWLVNKVPPLFPLSI